jgi:hypothetical protein
MVNARYAMRTRSAIAGAGERRLPARARDHALLLRQYSLELGSFL